MLPPNVTPEICYQKALKAIDRGKFPQAVKLLQIASLKAPDNKEIQEALRIAKAHASEQASPVNLLKEARRRIESGDRESAGKLLQLALAQAPNDGTVRAEVDALRGLIDAPKLKAQKKQKALDNLTKEATKEAPLPKLSPKVYLRPGIKSLVRIGILFVLFLFAVGNYYVVYSAKPIDSSFMAELIPVATVKSTRAHNELLVTLNRSEWDTMQTERPDLLSDVRNRAIEMGFQDVYIYDNESNLIASISGNSLYTSE